MKKSNSSKELTRNKKYYLCEIIDKNNKDIQITLLKQEIKKLKNDLLLKSIDNAVSNNEQKLLLLQEENELLNKKLQIFSDENNMLKNKLISLTNIIKENEKFRKEITQKFNCNQMYIQKGKAETMNNLYGSLKNKDAIRNKNLKDSLLELNKVLDELNAYNN